MLGENARQSVANSSINPLLGADSKMNSISRALAQMMRRSIQRDTADEAAELAVEHRMSQAEAGASGPGPGGNTEAALRAFKMNQFSSRRSVSFG